MTDNHASEDDLDRLLAAVLRQPSAARDEFLKLHCGNDPDLRSTLNRLIRESDDSDPFLKPGGAFDGPLWEHMLAESPELAAGARLGPYEIRGPIGSGGMGDVYRAHDARLGRDVAIKILPGDALASSHALARFEREARAVAALNHPNILAIHDVGSDSDVRYVVTELLEGDTLRQRLAAGPLPPSKAVEHGIQIAHGLAAAHDRGIVHRDVKPENVFITRDGRVKILDFGIASFDEANGDGGDTRGRPLTRSGVIPGTVGYTSPEQMLGNPATAQSDLFAFGVVLHEMLTGVHPFARTTAPETLTAVLRDDPPSVLRTVPDATPALARLVERCLQKRPADRPETARDIAFFLEVLPVSGATAPVASAAIHVLSVRELRTKLLAFSCGLVLLITAATWGYARVTADRAVRATVDTSFARAGRGVQRLHAEQVARLGLTARLVASFPELKALFATDVATIDDFLLGYRQRIANAPLLVAVGPDGTAIGRANTTGPATLTGGDDWIPSLLTAQGDGAVVSVGKQPYFAVAAPSEAGGTIFGYLVAAEPITQSFAAAVSEATQDEVVLLSHDDVLGSTFRTAETPWRSLGAWHAAGGSTERSLDLLIGSRRFAAREVALATDPPVAVVLVKSRDEVIDPYRRVDSGLLAIALVALAGATLGSVWLSKRLASRAVS